MTGAGALDRPSPAPHHRTMTMPEDLSRCLVLNTVAAARTLLRRYDAKLKPYGVTVQQFSLLAAIRFNPGDPVANLAPKIALDRTSLSRNLDRIEERGLVTRIANTGNSRICALTPAGDALLDSLLGEWQLAQAELLDGIGETEADTYLRLARRFSRD